MNYEDLLYELATNDKRYIIITAENRAAIRTLPQKISDQFLDTGITEQTMVGVAAGMALRGRIPIVHALATFLTMRAFEFIRTDVGIGNLPVKIVGAVPGFLSDANGPTHQSIEDISLMRGIPNMKIFCPADEDEMLKGLTKVFADESPFYIRYNNQKPLVEHDDFEIGKAEIFGDGKDIAILTYGFLFNQAYQAKELLEEKGYNIRLINLRTPKPIDEDAVLNAANDCKLLVTLEDHFITGGLFSILSELLLKNKRTADVLPIALMDKWFKPALLNDVLEYEGFTAIQVAEKIINKLKP
ncbi:MAG: transketolase C-terminal domain-containing protein [Melioribacteraceae bacterium]|nr:MAG: transketolase C-terminal domain-containing protein [Melioribacteraceae bacterium]